MKWIIALLPLVFGSGCIVTSTPSSLSYGTGKGVEPLTRESAAEAVKVGESVKSVSKAAFQTYAHTSEMSFTTRPYNFYCVILTPFSEVAVNAYHAKRKYETYDLAKLVIPPADQQVVKVMVSPSTEGTIELTSAARVVIRRGKEIVKPLKEETHEVKFSNKLGATETHKGITATFPLSEFTPDKGPFKIVIVPAGAPAGMEALLPLTVSGLKKLR